MLCCIGCKKWVLKMNDELMIKIDNKLQNQIDHLFSTYEIHDLRYKMYDLAFEWFMSGMSIGRDLARKEVSHD